MDPLYETAVVLMGCAFAFGLALGYMAGVVREQTRLFRKFERSS